MRTEVQWQKLRASFESYRNAGVVWTYMQARLEGRKMQGYQGLRDRVVHQHKVRRFTQVTCDARTKCVRFDTCQDWNGSKNMCEEQGCILKTEKGFVQEWVKWQKEKCTKTTKKGPSCTFIFELATVMQQQHENGVPKGGAIFLTVPHCVVCVCVHTLQWRSNLRTIFRFSLFCVYAL